MNKQTFNVPALGFLNQVIQNIDHDVALIIVSLLTLVGLWALGTFMLSTDSSPAGRAKKWEHIIHVGISAALVGGFLLVVVQITHLFAGI